MSTLVISVAAHGATAAPKEPTLPEQRLGSAANRAHQVAADATQARTEPTKRAAAKPPKGTVPQEAPKTPKPVSRLSNRPQQVSAATGKPGNSEVHGFDAKQSQVVPRLGDATSKVFQNPDQTYTVRTYSRPVRYQTATGEWADIDLNLTGAAGRWRQAANDVGVEVADNAADPRLQSLTLDEGHSLSFALQAAKSTKASISGNIAKYSEVLPGTDIEVEATWNGIKESLVLTSGQAATGPWDFPFQAKGLTARSSPQGVEFVDERGAVRVTVPAGFMRDAAGARSDAVSYTLIGNVLRVSADQKWLRANKRVFPVVIDPSSYVRTTSGAASDTYVDNHSGANHSGSDQLLVGSQDGTKRNNTYINFNLASQIPHAYVTGAALFLYNTLSNSCSANPVTVKAITSSWNVGTIASYPGVTLGDTWGSASFTGGVTCGGAGWAWIGINSAGLSALSDWANGAGNNGLALTADSFKEFASANSANPPYLQVDYSPWRALYVIGSDATIDPPVTANSFGKLPVTVINNGMNSWSPSTVKLGYKVYTTGGTFVGSSTAAASLPATIANNGSAKVSATIDSLNPGSYQICWDMVTNGQFFSDWGVPVWCVSLTVVNVPPQIDSMWPGSGYVESTLTPEFTVTGHDEDEWPGGSLNFIFNVCLLSDPNTCPATGLVKGDSNTGEQSANWTVPQGKLKWGEQYVWQALVTDGKTSSPATGWSTFSTVVPQPLVSSHVSDSAGTAAVKGVDPLTGQYAATTTDASLTTAGPALAITRSYSSLNSRAGMFGVGWTTAYDMRIVTDADWTGNVVVTYPDGRQARFGRNPDGTYAPPEGRSVSLVKTDLAWFLRDKSGGAYVFDPNNGRLTAIYDDDLHGEFLTYNGDGTLAKVVNKLSGRGLYFTWTSGVVTSVATDPAQGAPAWTYGYGYGLLAHVCPPGTTTACTKYTYSMVSHHRTAVVDAAPAMYYRLHQGATNEARQFVGQDDAEAVNLAFGAAGAPAGTTDGSATFNGTSSYLRMPYNITDDTTYAAVGMWFKTTKAGVLYGAQMNTLEDSRGPLPWGFLPMLYVGTDGKLHGQLADDGSCGGMSSTAAVNDGAWHHVVLTSSGTWQGLYVDGSIVDDRAKQIMPTHLPYASVGAGYMTTSGWCPAAPADTRGHFTGQIDDPAFYTHPLGPTAVTAQYKAGQYTGVLETVKLPSGKLQATLAYDAQSDRVASVTDANGGQWRVYPAQTQGSTEYYPNAVLSARPREYYRLAEYSGTRAASAAYGDGRDTDATYHNVTLNQTAPIVLATGGDTAAGFNGSSSYLELPDREIKGGGDLSAELWFKTAKPGVLLAYQAQALTDPAGPQANYTPALYVGTDGKLRGQFWDGAAIAPITTSTTVTDASWHHVALTASGGTQWLWLDGAVVGTRSKGPVSTVAQDHVYVGAGFIAGNWPAKPADTLGHFTGTIDEVALYWSSLNTDAIQAHYNDVATFGIPGTTVLAADPGGKAMVYSFDPRHGGRPTSLYDATGGTTRYGYDLNGNLASVTDPDGHTTQLFNDDRGNPVMKVTCRGPRSCQTSYFTYYLDAGNPLNPRNDKLTGTFDARATSTSDTDHRTSYTYDISGDLLSVTTPPVSGSGAGRTTKYTYTDGTEAAVDGGTVPDALLASVTTSGGKTTRFAYRQNGDLAQMVDPAGLTTKYDYDSAGRPTAVAQVSDAFPNGVTTSMGYDALNHLTATVGPTTTDVISGVKHLPWVIYTYDVDGNVTQVDRMDPTGKDATRTTTYTYDSAARVSSVKDAAGNTTTYGYDAYGNLNRTVDATGADYRQVYGPTGLLLTSSLANWVGDPLDNGSPKELVLESRAYDPAGRLATVTDAMGRTTRNHYYDDNLLESVWAEGFHNADGSTRDIPLQQNTYDSAGNLIQRVTGNGKSTTAYTVDAANRTTEALLDPAGIKRKTTYGYDDDDHIISLVQAQNSGFTWTTFDLDPLGRPLSQKVWDGAAWLTTSWTRDQRGLPRTMTDPRGAVTDYTHDEAGRLTTTKAPTVAIEHLGSTPFNVRPSTRAGYNSFGDVVTSEDAEGYRTTTAYDAMSRPLTVTLPSYTQAGAGATVTAGSTATYDALGRMTRAVDALGHGDTYTYDQLGNVVATTDAAGKQSRSGFDVAGEWLWTRDQAGRVTGATYDDLGRRISATAVDRTPTPAGYTTAFEYDDAGNLTYVTTPSGARSQLGYNAAGEVVVDVDPLSQAHWYTRDHAGRVTKVSNPDGTGSTLTFDGAGRATAVADLDASGNQLRPTTISYDAGSNPVTVNRPGGGVTTYDYDALNRLTGQHEKTTSTHSVTTTFGYDAVGNRTRFTDGNGNATLYGYNPWNLQVAMLVPTTTAYPTLAQRQTITDYDAAGRPVQVSKPGGVTIARTFDALNQLTAETGAGAETATTAHSFGYDAVGRQTSAGSDTFGYDDRDHLVSTAGPSGTASFTYDADGRMKARTDKAGTATYDYDAASRLTTVRDPLTGGTSTYSYDSMDQLKAVDYGGAKRSFDYDALHRPTSDTLKTNAGAVLAAIAYGYDDADRLTSKTTTGTAGAGANTYGYDLAGRLTSWNSVAYEYDDAGNRTKAGTAAAVYDARNQLVSDGSAGYAYSARGTLRSRTPTGGSASATSYDAFDRMITDGATTYAYDGLDRVASTAGRTFSYSGLGNTPAAAGTELYGRDPAGNIVSVAGLYAFTDRHGDLTATFTGAGVLTDSVAYDPYGKVVASSGTKRGVGYQGGWTDPATGKVNMAARWYDPGTGAFSSRDTLEVDPMPSAKGNRFAYADGDPLNQVDPTGHFGCPAFVCGTAKQVIKVVKIDIAKPVLTAADFILTGGGEVGAAARGSRFCGPVWLYCLAAVGVTAGAAYLGAKWWQNNWWKGWPDGSGPYIDYPGGSSPSKGKSGSTPGDDDDPGSSPDKGTKTPPKADPPPPPPPTPQELADIAAKTRATRPGPIDHDQLPGPAGISLADALDKGLNHRVDNAIDKILDKVGVAFTPIEAGAGDGQPNGGLDPAPHVIGQCSGVFGADAMQECRVDPGPGVPPDPTVQLDPCRGVTGAGAACSSAEGLSLEDAGYGGGNGARARGLFGGDSVNLARARDARRPHWSERLPMNMDTVRRVAQDWDIRIDDLTIRIDKKMDGQAGVTYPNQMVLLRRAAFRSEELLARTLAHERFHVGELRQGLPYPTTNEEADPYEDRAYAFEDDWWDNHPRNQ
ncbi:LamG-like jellyroll fold domain-containing protein [Nonomuraea sp. NEAU-A123]|uniref:LamG-like jellyroll fold domain-containing protein n=1 Tax=Nonomuraea sp. NEAU-A123 TaxID=2839649 RepID=UPI001BE4AC66|nr:LamG-like jellyroll fold domain-containing protein [Nonomuraea sp. NEAU-A123]MBT2231543.1 DNRLRE domain-containing protein [Nonomuraea sp. NEAU-A123]